MKHGSKFVCLMLALLVVLAMSVPAFAAGGDNTITVNGTKEGETYNIYKMLDLSVNAEKTAYTYTLNDDWEGFFTGTGAGVAYVAIDEKSDAVTWNADKMTDSDKEAFAKAAAKYAADENITPAKTAIKATGETVSFTGLDSGYYLITSTKGTLAIVATTPQKPNATVNEKNPDSTITKEVQEDSNLSWGENNDAQIGQKVDFRSTIEIKKGAKSYVMHDKMTAGLTFDASSIKVTDKSGATVATTNYTVVGKNDLNDGCTFEIQFKQTYLDTITENTTLTVTYSATLNENAKVDTPQTNDAKLTWGNNSETGWSHTETETHQFQLLKYAQADGAKNPLAGAVFQLEDKDGNVIKLVKDDTDETIYRVANGDETGAQTTFITVANKKITIIGVDSDKYFLREITAPEGYNLLADPVEVKVDENNAVIVEVANSTGAELPSTGGIGTTIFYVAGSVLVLGAVVVLVTRRRMSIKK